MDFQYVETLTPKLREALKTVNAHFITRTQILYDEQYKLALASGLDSDTICEMLGWISVALDHARKLQYDLEHPDWRLHRRRADILAAIDAVETPADRARYRDDDE
jgi:hypothetical protein